MPRRAKVLLAQLPIPQAAALCGTGNVPLAAGALAVAARAGAAGRLATIDVLSPSETDVLGDALLADRVLSEEPDVFCLSLYLWNVERSLALAREVKRRSPKTTIVVGGPEVADDSNATLGDGGFDVAVSGEAEPTFDALTVALLSGGDPASLPGVSVFKRGEPFLVRAAPPADFPLDAYPSPYLAGVVPIDPRRPTYVETVRGCRSACTFCFYPRSSASLRSLDPKASAELVADLASAGARDLVFLDPTFNHRPGFEELLAELAVVNKDRSLTFFGEVRAEGLTESHADALAAAGFTKLEIGLQSVNPRALKLSKRGGDPERVAAAAKMLKARGVDLLVDLIVGLPGDGPDDVARGVDFLLRHGLGEDAQVFPLALLPGTAMRAEAARDGVRFEARPPYRAIETPTFRGDALLSSLFAAEEALDRRLDETPRPFLVEPSEESGAPPDVLKLDLARSDSELETIAARGAAHHVAAWFCGDDLFFRRDAILRCVDARLRVDPFGVLDAVLMPRRPFPLDLFDLLRARFDTATASYASRVLSHRGENLLRRAAVVLPRGVRFPDDWIEAASACAPLYAETTFMEALSDARSGREEFVGVRILDAPPKDDGGAAWRDLFESADPDRIAFARRDLEAAWIGLLLGHRRPEDAPR